MRNWKPQDNKNVNHIAKEAKAEINPAEEIKTREDTPINPLPDGQVRLL